jgi:electron transport complex protein RnfC
MMISLATFPKGGVHPKENKDLTNALPIETMPDPPTVSLFLKQHVGAPCEVAVPHRTDPRCEQSVSEDLLFSSQHPGALFRLLVDKKDKVKEGDQIGEIGTRLGAELHASVGGTVLGVENMLHHQVGTAPAIVIRTDPEAVEPAYTPVDWRGFSRERIQSASPPPGSSDWGGPDSPPTSSSMSNRASNSTP